jgi:hypothetical protein
MVSGMLLACHPIPRVEAESGVMTALLGDSLLGEQDVA